MESNTNEILGNSSPVESLKPLNFNAEIKGSKVKKITIDLTNNKSYGSLSLFADGALLLDNLDVSKTGRQKVNAVIGFKELGDVNFKLSVRDAEMTIHKITVEDAGNLEIPKFTDISEAAGLDRVNSIKYGGPSIADINQDGYYDFIVNNHNQESSKLYWNNGDGTVTKHSQNLARWYMHDLHGTALGDYDNDGDLDLVVTQGGGNGANPSIANYYKNDYSNFIRFTGDVGITRGARGRGARWSDYDLDGDLDLMLVNEEGLKKEKPQHFYYENLGDGTFKFKDVPGIQDAHPSRALITDINGDHIDDIILYGPLSIWKGNGDFTFTEVTAKMLKDLPEYKQIMALADVDIDNDGDLDLYLARGLEFEGGKGETPSLDSDPVNKEMALKTRGYKGVDAFEFIGDNKIKLHNYYYLAQGDYRGKTYPIFLGENKKEALIPSGQDFEIDSKTAQGWPKDISADGFYIGAIGDNKWKAALVRNGDLFWSYRFSLSGVEAVMPEFVPQNRNVQDILLRNDNGVFTDVSEAYNIQPGGNSLGVTVGDFNNDSYQDIFVYRWGFIGSRTSDYMLLNTGNGAFETVTMHGANAIGDAGNGDMGQAFDFDLDGGLDLLNGSEGGMWYLYANKNPGSGNYALVRVGYAPKSNIDAISAEVIVKTANHEYRKRVGSAGEVFSQSLLNMVHFGLGTETKIESVTVRWRNGETVVFNNKAANAIIDTNKLDPEGVVITDDVSEIRKGTSMPLIIKASPKNADQEVQWASSNPEVLKVGTDGVVEAVGNIGEKTTITATSVANGLKASKEISIVDWYAQPIETIVLSEAQVTLFENESLQLETTLNPKYADNQNLVWESSHPEVATVDDLGKVKALKAGKTKITVASAENPKVSAHTMIKVEPFVKPFIKLLNKEKFNSFNVGDNITVEAEYYAGSGQKVINADEGGVRLWLRHFKNEWVPIKDVVLVDETALNKVSGKAVKTFSLKGLTPTKDLPEGQFYMLRATFTSSDGIMYNDQVYPLNIKP
ncbi:FG-GAP-like repeat-containing protein [Tamlana sp. I1]|uniref:FG-GAP-like repeat-containing protein n=1 Tax=Tamlana sp. I1 TaxID=2762061 RepID=UPI00188E37A5|nr:FG-GAP-like repeat-containing protein [Tamlana sp. I1]